METELLKWVSTSAGRLDRVLATQFPEFSRSQWQRVIEQGFVSVGGSPARAGLLIKIGILIEGRFPENAPIHNLKPAVIDLEIAFEDEFLVIVNKPAGMVTHPAPGTREPTLVHALLGMQLQLSAGSHPYRPGIVHRLDKDTSGLLIVAKTDGIHRKLAEMIQLREVDRRYLLVVSGEPPKQDFTVEGPIARDPRNRLKMAIVADGKPARTHFHLIKEEAGLTLLEAKLESGRTHQIRVHAASIGLPVVGDSLYNPLSSEFPMQLHAWRLSLSHPITGSLVDVSVPPPVGFCVTAESYLKMGGQT